MLITLAGIFIFSTLSYPKNALLPMVVTFSPIKTSLILLIQYPPEYPAENKLPTLLQLKVIDVSEGQPVKTPFPISLTFLGIIKDEIEEHP